MGNNFKRLKISGYKIFAIQALKFTSNAQIVKTKRFDECILAFERRRQTNFLRRANISSRFLSKHLCHRCMEHKKKQCILAKFCIWMKYTSYFSLQKIQQLL